MHDIFLGLSSFLIFIMLRTGVHVTLDSLMLDEDLKTIIKDMVLSSGRSDPVNETNASSSEKKLMEKVQEKISAVQINGNT